MYLNKYSMPSNSVVPIFPMAQGSGDRSRVDIFSSLARRNESDESS
jgi:hypothetical protein